MVFRDAALRRGSGRPFPPPMHASAKTPTCPHQRHHVFQLGMSSGCLPFSFNACQDIFLLMSARTKRTSNVERPEFLLCMSA